MTISWPGGFPQQGWICPKCGRVYAPFCPSCFVCGQKETVVQPNTLPPQPKTPDPTVPELLNPHGVPKTSGSIAIPNPSGTIVYPISSGSAVYRAVDPADDPNVSYTLF